MQLLSLVFWLLRRRLRNSWLLLAVTSFGILASVTIMSTGALYSRALGEAGLRHFVASFSPEVHNGQITAQNRPLGRTDYLPLEALVEVSSTGRLGEMLRSTERFGRTQLNLTLLATPTSPVLGSPEGRPFFLTGFEEHSDLTQGRWPKSGTFQDSDGQGDIEIVLGFETSRKLSYFVGDRIFLVPRRGSPERIPFKVVGVVEPIDANEEYWMDAPIYFDLVPIAESVVGSASPPLAPSTTAPPSAASPASSHPHTASSKPATKPRQKTVFIDFGKITSRKPFYSILFNEWGIAFEIIVHHCWGTKKKFSNIAEVKLFIIFIDNKGISKNTFPNTSFHPFSNGGRSEKSRTYFCHSIIINDNFFGRFFKIIPNRNGKRTPC